MERLRDVTGANTALHELREGKRVCIEKVESKQVLRDTILIGDQFPVMPALPARYCWLTSRKKSWKITSLRENRCRVFRRRTITNPRKLVAELARIKSEAWHLVAVNG